MSQPLDNPDANGPLVNTLALVGVGLMGGSIAAAAKQRGLVGSVIGVGRSRAKLAAAVASGLIDVASDDLAEAARQADLILFCTPVDCIAEGVRTAAAACRPGTLLTDAGSVKAPICDALREAFPTGSEFVGSHPIAGSEKQGFEHADPNLFAGRLCVVTPVPGSTRGAVERIAQFWQGLGMRVAEMSPGEHDHVLSETSHFPHLAAAALAATLGEAHRPFTATGFRDTTRIAAGDPDIWTAILMQNATEVMGSLDKFARQLNQFRSALRARDAVRLRELLTTAKQIRDSLTTPPPCAGD